jgi:hypothetical protein
MDENFTKNFRRADNSKALLNKNASALEEYKRRKNEANEIKKLKSEVEFLQSEVRELRRLILERFIFD